MCSTCPPTTTSPSPYAASMSKRPRSCEIGSTVNITPDDSESTIRCTTTAMAGSSLSPRLFLYAITRGPQSDAQQSRMRSIRVSLATLVKVSFMPAKDACALSSAVADDRTATRAPSPSSWTACIAAERTSSGTPARRTEACNSSDASLSALESSRSVFSMMSSSRCRHPAMSSACK